MCCGVVQTVLETGAPISWNSSQNVERLDGGRSSRAEHPSERGHAGNGHSPSGKRGDNGGQAGKAPGWAPKRCSANEGREQGINVSREGFDSEQKRMILVIVCKKHSSYLWATTIIGRIM